MYKFLKVFTPYLETPYVETSFAVGYQSPGLSPWTPRKHWSLQVMDSLKFGGFNLAPCQHWKVGENIKGKWETEKSHVPVGFFSLYSKCQVYLSITQVVKKLAVV